jgi:hypothetical protein
MYKNNILWHRRKNRVQAQDLIDKEKYTTSMNVSQRMKRISATERRSGQATQILLAFRRLGMKWNTPSTIKKHASYQLPNRPPGTNTDNLLSNHQPPHGSLHFTHRLINTTALGGASTGASIAIQHPRSQTRVPDAQRSTKHPLPRVSNSRATNTIGMQGSGQNCRV